MNLHPLKSFLERHHSAATTKNYLFEIQHFIQFMGEAKAQQASYPDMLKYLAHLRKKYDNPGTISRILQALKQYYFYLIDAQIRKDHPCRYLSLKDKYHKPIQVQDLLTTNELELLLKRKERYQILTTRNQVAMSLLVYQALLPKEIAALTTHDIDVEKATIRIHPTHKTNGRTLQLQAQQILLFYQYLHQIRPQLLRNPTDVFLLTKLGTAEKGEGLHYLCETFRKQFPTKKLTPTTIRQSVIANMLKEGKDLRVVQVFAGHKKPSATEKYKQSNLEVLKKSVEQFHPLG